MTAFRLETRDLEQLQRSGIPLQEAERQGRLLTSPPAPTVLVRPCRSGDGIELIEEAHRGDLARRFQKAAAAGRTSIFVPASGAATRMFKTLVEASQGEDRAIEKVESKLLPHLEELALSDELVAALEIQGTDLRSCDREKILRTILDPNGMATASRPKGLVPFHKTAQGGRTAFDEHLAEAAEYLVDDQGLCRLHFTVPESRQESFTKALEEARRRMGSVRLEVTFSVQGHDTDTLAVDERLAPFRLEDGWLLLRPGGHGALLANLVKAEGDIVFVKNIDNIQPARRRKQIVNWKAVLGGRLLELEDRIHELRPRLTRGVSQEDLAAAAALCRELNNDPGELPEDSDAAIDRLADCLDRPLRVCGMVPNAGEPGGGPFWIRLGDRIAPQIVEAAQVDLANEDQARIWASSTHFNPVDLALSLRDADGEPWDLREFRDDNAVFLPRKSHGGRDLRALEHPGLWNGSMAYWNTVFVEVPAETFAPVKTLFDLLRDEHRE